MQARPRYDDVVAEVRDWLAARADAAMAAGVARERIWLDPGIGFRQDSRAQSGPDGTSGSADGAGVSRALRRQPQADMVQAVDTTATDPMDRLGGSIALALEGARRGAAMVRVHDVRETVQALKVQAAVAGA